MATSAHTHTHTHTQTHARTHARTPEDIPVTPAGHVRQFLTELRDRRALARAREPCATFSPGADVAGVSPGPGADVEHEERLRTYHRSRRRARARADRTAR